MTRLYVGGLAREATEDDLRKMFEPSGTVTSAVIATEKGSGRSKGFGFVEMQNEEEARAAIASLNGTSVAGRSLKVEAAKLPERSSGTE